VGDVLSIAGGSGPLLSRYGLLDIKVATSSLDQFRFKSTKFALGICNLSLYKLLLKIAFTAPLTSDKNKNTF
jgi:hypothetical protein